MEVIELPSAPAFLFMLMNTAERAARRIAEAAFKLPEGKPTVHELEAIMSGEEHPVMLRPDGSLCASDDAVAAITDLIQPSVVALDRFARHYVEGDQISHKEIAAIAQESLAHPLGENDDAN